MVIILKVLVSSLSIQPYQKIRTIISAVEYFVDIEEVASSNLASSTKQFNAAVADVVIATD